MAEHVIFVRRPHTDEDDEYAHKFKMRPMNIAEMMLRRLSESVFEHEFYDPDEKIRRLSRRVSRLEAKLKAQPVRTRGEEVYEMLLPMLKKNYLGKVVAIDTDEEDVAGVGDTVEEAYDQARNKFPEKEQFYFRRVGKSYLFRV